MKTRPNGCSLFQWLEWTISISHLPGKPQQLRALWSFHFTALWVNNPSLNVTQCRFSDEARFTPTSEGAARQSMTGTYDPETQTLNFVAVPVDCFGSACKMMFPDPPPGSDVVKLRSFARKLVYDHGILSFQVDPTHAILLRRTADSVEDLLPAAQMRDTMWAAAEKNKTATLDALSASGAPSFTQPLMDLQSRLGRIVNREPITAFLALNASDPASQPSQGPLVLQALFGSTIYTERGLRATEFLWLIRENQDWRVRWIYIQSSVQG